MISVYITETSCEKLDTKIDKEMLRSNTKQEDNSPN